MQSHLKNLWPSTSRVEKIYIPILLQSPNIEENRHLGKLILASEKTNSTVGFSIGPTSSPGLFPQKMIYWGKALGTNSHFQNEAKCKTFPRCETQRIKIIFQSIASRLASLWSKGFICGNRVLVEEAGEVHCLILPPLPSRHLLRSPT